MPGHRYTPAEYALQKVVECFGILLSELAEHYLNHTYTGVLCVCQLENIDFLMLRYIKTGALPFEEYSEEWLSSGEVLSMGKSETAVGTISTWKDCRLRCWNSRLGKRMLLLKCKRLSLRIRRAKKEIR